MEQEADGLKTAGHLDDRPDATQYSRPDINFGTANQCL